MKTPCALYNFLARLHLNLCFSFLCLFARLHAACACVLSLHTHTNTRNQIAAPLYASAYYKPKTTELFGSPLLLCHPKTTSTKALYEAVARAVSPKEGAIRPEAFSLFVAKVWGSYWLSH